MNKTNIIGIGVIAVLIALLSLSECRRQHDNQTHTDYENALTGTMKITKDKLGRETAEIQAIQADYGEFKHMHLLTTDSLGRELQKLVDRRTGSATIATQEVHVQGDFKTTRVDTIEKIGPQGQQITDFCHPVYTLKLDESYRRGTIIAGADSFKVDLIYPETLVFKTEASRWNLFKPTTMTSSYTNSNPNVEITGLRTYTQRCDCKKKSWISLSLGAAGGFGLGFLAGRVR